MYFSDEIILIGKTYAEDDIGQRVPIESEKTVFCDLQSISGAELSRAGQIGIQASAKAVVHAEDYSGEDEVSISNSNQVKAGRYSVYRTYRNTDTVELYLQERN